MFQLLQFPLVSKCGKIASICEELPEKTLSTELENFPGDTDAFLIAVKFCYGARVELTPRNIVKVYCAADYLEMTEDFGEGNLLAKSESFLHKNVLQNWKDCVLALRSCDPILPMAENLQIVTKCLNALSLMASTDPSLFGWPMMMYGRLQSPGGSILWNGIHTGARIRSSKSDWWFEDISYLNVSLFARLIKVMESTSLDLETSPSSDPLRKVAKLIDNYIAEVASDVNLKPVKIRSLAEALPDSARTFHDGLYRAMDIYFKAHPWLSETEKEELCNIIDYQKLSIDACAHASQNNRLPLRIVLQVLFFEQMQLRRALAGCLRVLNTESGPPITLPTENITGQIARRDWWVTVVRENQVLKLDLENMRSRVGELEQEFNGIKQEMRKVTKSHSSLSSPRFFARRIGCKLLPRPSDAQPLAADSNGHTPRASIEQPHSSRHFPRHRKSFSLV
ncbi:BTB/POZ domain-containing protein At3g44820 [Linum perenne]